MVLVYIFFLKFPYNYKAKKKSRGVSKLYVKKVKADRRDLNKQISCKNVGVEM